MIVELSQPLQDLAISREPTKTDPACTRAKRDLNDPFFLKGYQLAFEGVVYYVEHPVGDDVSRQISDRADRHEIPTGYPCTECYMTFASLSACDAHYDESHVFQCRECHDVLPSDHLLDLHLQEAHDSYFLAAVERGLHKFSCLVCDEQFCSFQDRLQHLIESHGYPKWFRFIAKAEAGDDGITKKKLNWIDHRLKPSGKDDTMMETEFDESKCQRRARQKAKRSTIPCKYYHAKGGCWRGSKCMFLHSDGMHDLSTQLKKMAKVTVPEIVSFGRRRR